jgi:hypothetical protein
MRKERVNLLWETSKGQNNNRNTRTRVEERLSKRLYEKLGGLEAVQKIVDARVIVFWWGTFEASMRLVG